MPLACCVFALQPRAGRQEVAPLVVVEVAAVVAVVTPTTCLEVSNASGDGLEAIVLGNAGAGRGQLL